MTETENRENTVKWAEDLEAEENGRAYKHITETVIPEYILNGPNTPFDTSADYKRDSWRNQPFPVSPSLLDYRAEDPDPEHGGAYWVSINRVLDNEGNAIPMFSRSALMQLCQAEFEKQTGRTAHWTTRMRKDALEAAGIEVIVDPVVNLFGSPAIAAYWTPGTWPFGGNRLQMPTDGALAVNPHNGFEYVFLRKRGPVGISGYWVSPVIYRQARQQ
jgi:hypothetical protein